jgi:hypothetical protein
LVLESVLILIAIHGANNQGDDERDSLIDPDSYSSESSTGSLSPWSDEDSEHLVDVNHNIPTGNKRKHVSEIDVAASVTSSHAGNAPDRNLSVFMRQVESTLSQLICLGFKIRQSANTERVRKADATLATRDHEVFRKHLIFMLSMPKNGILATVDANAKLFTDRRYPEGLLNRVQVRLIDSNLKRRNRFMYAWNHAKSLASDAGSAWKVSQGTNVDGSSGPNNPTRLNEPSHISGISSDGSQLLNIPGLLAGPFRPGSNYVSTITRKMEYPRPPLAARSESLGFQCPCCAQVLPRTVGTNLRQWRLVPFLYLPLCEEIIMLPELSTSFTTKKENDCRAVMALSTE